MIKLEEVLYYYGMREGRDHTLAALEGAKNMDECLYMAPTYEEAVSLKNRYPNLIPVDINNANALHGMDSPLVIDHRALTLLVREYDRDRLVLMQEIRGLKARIEELEK